MREPYPPKISLADESVHLWRVNLDVSARQQTNLLRLLSQPEDDRANHFLFERDRRCFVVSHGVLRLILSRYLNCIPELVNYQIGENGKPYISNKSNIHFNLTHSHEIALVAVTCLGDIGVDVEFVRPLEDMDLLARQCFSSQEYAQFKSLAATENLEAFFTCWTRKESFLKAKGSGLDYPLDHFTVTLLPTEPARLVMITGEPDEAAKWTLQAIEFDSHYKAAFALKAANPRVQYMDWISISE